MSRSDYIFFNTLGQRYKEQAQQLEHAKSFACAATNYAVAGECFAKADEIARDDQMTDYGATRLKKEYCEKKAKRMQNKSREKDGSASKHGNK